MIEHEQNSKETNPYLMEVWQAGYTHCIQDDLNCTVKLYKEKELIKTLSHFDIVECCNTITIKKAFTLNGEIIEWLKESDGSADRFRKLIAYE